jgi:hypothetical protein
MAEVRSFSVTIRSQFSYLVPELLAAGAGSRGERKDGRLRVFFSKGANRVPQLVAGKAVGLGGYDQGRTSNAGKKIQQLVIRRLWWHIHID